MKKFVLLLTFLMVLLFVLPASAEIERETDDFDGKTTVESCFSDLDGWRFIGFNKVIATGNYQFWISKEFNKKLFYSACAEIKIDGVIHKIKILDSQSDLLSGGKYYSVLSSSFYKLSNNIIEALKKAKKVSFRINFTNQPSQVWEVPDYVLAEWKEVIKTTF